MTLLNPQPDSTTDGRTDGLPVAKSWLHHNITHRRLDELYVVAECCLRRLTFTWGDIVEIAARQRGGRTDRLPVIKISARQQVITNCDVQIFTEFAQLVDRTVLLPAVTSFEHTGRLTDGQIAYSKSDTCIQTA